MISVFIIDEEEYIDKIVTPLKGEPGRRVRITEARNLHDMAYYIRNDWVTNADIIAADWRVRSTPDPHSTQLSIEEELTVALLKNPNRPVLLFVSSYFLKEAHALSARLCKLFHDECKDCGVFTKKYLEAEMQFQQDVLRSLFDKLDNPNKGKTVRMYF